MQVVEHHCNSFAYHLAILLGFFDKLKIHLTLMLVVRTWLVKLKHLAHLYNIVTKIANLLDNKTKSV